MPTKTPSITVVALAALTALIACELDGLQDTTLDVSPSFSPEGLEIHPWTHRFLVGSLSEGSVWHVRPNGKVRRALSKDDHAWYAEHDLGTVGLHADPERDRLLVAVTHRAVLAGVVPGYVDPGLEQLEGIEAGLAAYRLSSGEMLFFADFTDLAPGVVAYANDVTVDDDGTAYVTDTAGGAIYAVHPEGTPSLLVEGAPLANPIFGPNGIEHVGNGDLIVSIPGLASLARVPVDDAASMTIVGWAGPPFAADGLVLAEDGVLVATGFYPAIDPGTGALDLEQTVFANLALSSGDDWATAQVDGVSISEVPMTTAAVHGDDVFTVTTDVLGFGTDTVEILEVDFESDPAQGGGRVWP